MVCAECMKMCCLGGKNSVVKGLMAFLVCLLFRESIGVAITKSFVIFVRKFFVSSTCI